MVGSENLGKEVFIPKTRGLLGERFLLVWLLTYKLALDIVYYGLISKLWSYYGLGMNLNATKLFESYLLFLPPVLLMPKAARTVGIILLWLMILISYMPMLTLFAFKDEPRAFMYAVAAFWVGVVLLYRYSPNMSVLSLKESGLPFALLGLSLSVATFAMLLSYFGFSIRLNIGAAMYETRSQFVSSGLPRLGFYLVIWQAYSVAPIFLARFFLQRRWLYVVLICILQLFIFTCVGMKSFLFIPVFVIVAVLLVKRKNVLTWIVLGLVVFIILGAASYYVLDDMWLHSLIVRRNLFTPAQLAFNYYDFFSHHEQTYLSHSVLRGALRYPYPLNPPHLIGKVYFGAPTMGANNGIVGDAYMNFGFIGLVMWGLLFAFILKVVDAVTRNKDFRMGVACMLMPALVFTNSALLTCLLTHGVLLLLLLLYLLPKERYGLSRSGPGLENPVCGRKENG